MTPYISRHDEALPAPRKYHRKECAAELAALGVAFPGGRYPDIAVRKDSGRLMVVRSDRAPSRQPVERRLGVIYKMRPTQNTVGVEMIAISMPRIRALEAA